MRVALVILALVFYANAIGHGLPALVGVVPITGGLIWQLWGWALGGVACTVVIWNQDMKEDHYEV